MASTKDLAKELRELSHRAESIESVMRHTESTLVAIEHGGLLDALPADETDAEKHSAATVLLSRLLDELRRLTDLPGTDVSIALRATAQELQAH